MESAFGIDHGYDGEIEKFSIGGALKPLGSAFQAGAKGMHGPQATAGLQRAQGAGQMARKVGQFGIKNKKPLAIGGGVGAAGGLGAASMGNRRQ